MVSLCPLLARLVLFKGQKQQLVFAGLVFVNFLLTLFTLNTSLDDDRRNSEGTYQDGQAAFRLVDLAYSPGADAFLMSDYEIKSTGSSGGYGLAKRVQEKCSHSKVPPFISKKVKVSMPYRSNDNNTQFCAIWKIAETFITRLFMIEKKNGSGILTYNPYDIPFSTRYLQSQKYISNSKHVRRFMFTQNPYNRLYAAYVDTLYVPNPLVWKGIGVDAIKTTRRQIKPKSLKCGHDLKFSEYIKFIILTLSNTTVHVSSDSHSVPAVHWCKPCEIKYDFIGKMETFGNDSLEIVKQLQLPQSERLLRERGEEQAANDAIRETLHHAFDPIVKSYYIDCISFREALTRCWKALQYRGLIGNMELALSDEELERISFYQMVNMAKRARAGSTQEDRDELQRRHFLNLYSSVTVFDLGMLRHIYRHDFEMFEYDDSPSSLFERI